MSLSDSSDRPPESPDRRVLSPNRPGDFPDPRSDASGLAPQPSKPAEEATFGQTAAAVFWSFFGVRRKSAFERDHRALNPVHVVIMGLLAAAIFVGTLVTIVLLITRQG